MNKKFSTLVASLLLATTVGTVSAQSVDFTKSAVPSSASVATVADGRAYQLSDGYNVLTMQKVSTTNGDRFILKFVPYYQANVGESLWYVKVIKNNEENGVAFKFMNLAHNYPISFDPSKAQKYVPGKSYEVSYLAGEATAWAWMRHESGTGLNIAKTPEAYFSTDSVMTLVSTADGSVASVKYDVKEIEKVAQLNFRPQEAGPVWLNKYDLNSMLQTQELGKTSFAFAKDVTEGQANLWCGDDHGKKYEAVDAVGQETLSSGIIANADADVKAAVAAENEAYENLNAAVHALGEAESAYKAIAEELATTQKTKGEKEFELTPVEYSYNAVKGSILTQKENIQSLQQSILFKSGLTEVAKEQVDKAAKQLETAQTAFSQAEGAYNALNKALTEAVEEETTALTKKNEAWAELEDQKEKADYATNVYKTLVDVFYYTYELSNETHLNNIYEVVEANTVEEKDYVDGLVNRFLDAAETQAWWPNATDNKQANQVDELQAFALEYQEFSIEELEKAFAEAEAEHTKAEAIAESYREQVNTAVTTKNKAESALESAQAAYDQEFSASGVLDEALAEDKKALDDATAKLTEMEATLSDLEAKKTSLEETISDLAEQISDLNKQLTEQEGSKGAAYWAWVDARYAHKDAQRATTKAAEVYAQVKEERAYHWLSLKAGKDSKNRDTYLMVDTAYLNGSAGAEVAGIQHLTFAVREHETDFVSSNILAARDINGRFNFRFLYYPTQDSLHIEADGYNHKNVTTRYWKDRSNSEIDVISSTAKGYEQNLVKVAVLGGARREVTIGSSENLKGTDVYTINDRIGLNIAPAQHAAVLEAGIYFLDVVNGADKQKNGARLMLDLNGWSLTKVAPVEWDVMNFEHMPAAKWVVDKNTNEFGGYPEIWNQEIGRTLNNGAYKVLENNENEAIIVIDYYYHNEEAYLANDTLKLTKTVSNRLGYYNEDPKNVNFTLNYLNVNPGLAVTIGNSTVGDDTILRVSADDATKFDLERSSYYWYNRIYGTDTIKVSSYRIRVNDPYKFANDQKYVQVSEVGGTEMLVVADRANASLFQLKEVNCVDGTHYYALLTQGKKAGVIDATGLIKVENLATESTTSAFALVADTTRLYRELTADELGENGAIGFYRVNSTAKAYLYEGENNLLCVEGKGDDKAEAFTVIPTGVENTLMPQYLIAKDVNFVAGDTVLCDATTHSHATTEEALKCPHSKVTADTTFGRFLVNMIDSTKAGVKLYKWENKYTRLAFLPGYIADGNLVLDGTTHKVALKANAHDMAKFSFRLVSDESDDFLIESESHDWKNGQWGEFNGTIAPSANMGGWVKVQNGVPVIINDFEAAMQSDLYNVVTNEGGATANDEVTISEVTVIAGEGQVTITGAAGKKVVITNILGQTVANTVLTSDNAAVAAPQGVVVVAVEGEEAVKAIVR